MNKTELIAAVAEKAEISKKDSEKALKAFIDVVTDELKNGERCQLVGFGTIDERTAGRRKSDEIGQVFKGIPFDQETQRSE